MARWKLRSQTRCPRCSSEREDKDHIFCCPAALAVALWEKALGELDNWMQATNTHPQLWQDILAGLRQWHNGETPQFNQVSSSPVCKQDKIGWGLVLEGCLVRRWQEEQDIFWKAIKSRKSSQHWTTALLTWLMTMAWDMWQHWNKALHELEVNRQEIVEANINWEICQTYAQGSSPLPRAARPLMRQPLAQVLTLPATYKCQWMATVAAVRIRVQNLARIPAHSLQHTSHSLVCHSVNM